MKWTPSIQEMPGCCSIQVVNGFPFSDYLDTFSSDPIYYAKRTIEEIRNYRADVEDDYGDPAKCFLVSLCPQDQKEIYKVFRRNPEVFKVKFRTKSCHGNYYIYVFEVNYASNQEIK